MSSVFYECTEQKYQCAGAKRPCLPWKGVAERSDSFKIMIAGGNHTAIKRWLSVSETGGVCASTELYKKTPQSARSGCQLPFQGSRGRFAPVCAIQPGACGNPGLRADSIRPTGRSISSQSSMKIFCIILWKYR